MFTDSLKMLLELTIGEKVVVIPGGNIKTLKIDHTSCGFECLLSFWVASETQPDELFPFFLKPDLIEAKLTVISRFASDKKDIESLDLKGLVTHKKILMERVVEHIEIKGDPVLYRHYQILFAASLFLTHNRRCIFYQKMHSKCAHS